MTGSKNNNYKPSNLKTISGDVSQMGAHINALEVKELDKGPEMCQGLGWIPALLGVLMVTSIVTTYFVAVMNGNVEAFFPYISDTGVGLPESCIFSQFFNMAAALALIVMYLRYKLIFGLTEGAYRKINTLSKVNLVVACFSCLGLSFVANFQETSIEPVHFTGAFLVFGLGVVYAFIDTAISYIMYPYYNGLAICRARLAIGVLGLFSLLTSVISGAISRRQWAAAPPKDHQRLHWKPDDPGYDAHLVSTFGEWGMAAAFLFYYVTFVPDFNKFHVEVTPIIHDSSQEVPDQPAPIRDQDLHSTAGEHSRLVV